MDVKELISFSPKEIEAIRRALECVMESERDAMMSIVLVHLFDAPDVLPERIPPSEHPIGRAIDEAVARIQKKEGNLVGATLRVRSTLRRLLRWALHHSCDPFAIAFWRGIQQKPEILQVVVVLLVSIERRKACSTIVLGGKTLDHFAQAVLLAWAGYRTDFRPHEKLVNRLGIGIVCAIAYAIREVPTDAGTIRRLLGSELQGVSPEVCSTYFLRWWRSAGPLMRMPTYIELYQRCGEEIQQFVALTDDARIIERAIAARRRSLLNSQQYLLHYAGLEGVLEFSSYVTMTEHRDPREACRVLEEYREHARRAMLIEVMTHAQLSLTVLVEAIDGLADDALPKSAIEWRWFARCRGRFPTASIVQLASWRDVGGNWKRARSVGTLAQRSQIPLDVLKHTDACDLTEVARLWQFSKNIEQWPRIVQCIKFGVRGRRRLCATHELQRFLEAHGHSARRSLALAVECVRSLSERDIRRVAHSWVRLERASRRYGFDEILQRPETSNSNGNHILTPETSSVKPLTVERVATLLELNGTLPSYVDAAMARAIIVYGFVHPGKGVAFFGHSYLPRRHIRSNVSRRHEGFDEDVFDDTFRWLECEGVIAPYYKPGTDDLWRVNTKEVTATELGRALIQRVKAFAFRLLQQTS